VAYAVLVQVHGEKSEMGRLHRGLDTKYRNEVTNFQVGVVSLFRFHLLLFFKSCRCSCLAIT
jgi:hypothetical protein